MGNVGDYTIEQSRAGYGEEEHAMLPDIATGAVLPGERPLPAFRTRKKDGPRVGTARV
jgi:hypothetical protein